MTLEEEARAFATANPTDNGADWAGLCGVLAYRMCLDYGTPPSSVPATAKIAADAAGYLNPDAALAPIGAFHYWNYGTDGHVGLDVNGGGSKVFMASTYISEVLAPDLGFQTVVAYTRPPTFTYRGWSLNYGVNGRVSVTEAQPMSTVAFNSFFIWIRQISPINLNITGNIIFGNGIFVAISAFTPTLITSTDGRTWTPRTLPPINHQWLFVTYGNGIFVATANYGNIYATSSDGITWTARTLPTVSWTARIVYINGLFITYENTVLFTSPDGITWTTGTCSGSPEGNNIAYGNGIFVTVRYNSNISSTSIDGITWTARTLPSSQGWSAIRYGNGIFVAMTLQDSIAATSSDGITWTARTAPFSYNGTLSYGNGLFTMTGYTTTLGHSHIFTSPDGIIWTEGTFPEINSNQKVFYLNNIILLTDGDGDIYIYSKAESINIISRFPWQSKGINLRNS